jgi:hypothetical protein
MDDDLDDDHEVNLAMMNSSPNRRKRSRSIDSEYIWHQHRGRHSDSENSRSCSPAASNGLELGYMKDSHMMQLDNDTMSEAGSLVSDSLFTSDSNHGQRSMSALNNSSTASKSVMSGGSVKGWLPDVAVVLWRRMLGALGNINAIGKKTGICDRSCHPGY